MTEPVEEVSAAHTDPTLTSAKAMLEEILMKEEEIKERVQLAKNEAQLRVDEAKLDAAQKKREAESDDVGAGIREEMVAKARKEAEAITAGIADKVEEIQAMGENRLEAAIEVVIEGILPVLG